MAIVGAYVGFSKALVIVFPVFLLAWLRFAHRGGRDARRGCAGPPTSRRSTRAAAGLLFLESFFGNFLFSICMLFGIRQSSALAAGVIMAALPAVVAMLSWLAAARSASALRVAAGIACAIGGIALVSLRARRRGRAGERLAARQRCCWSAR